MAVLFFLAWTVCLLFLFVHANFPNLLLSRCNLIAKMSLVCAIPLSHRNKTCNILVFFPSVRVPLNLSVCVFLAVKNKNFAEFLSEIIPLVTFQL